MRKELLLALMLAASLSPGQVAVRTRTFGFGKPVLGVRGDFLGENGTTWLNANSGGRLMLSISNSGTATARGVIVMLSPGSELKDLQIPRVDSLGDIKPGEITTEKIAVSASEDARPQKGVLSIVVKAEPGHITAETNVDITVREVPVPRLDIRFLRSGEAVAAGHVSKMALRVRNTGTGEARGVSVTFFAAGPASETAIAEIGKSIPLGNILQGSSKDLTLTLKPDKNADGSMAIAARVNEEREKFSIAETLSVQVSGNLAAAQLSGFTAFKKGDYLRAIASLERVVAGGKATRDVYYALGVSYFKNRDGRRCLANMQKSSSLGSKEAKAWIRENTSVFDVTTVTYKQIAPDPYEGYRSPVGLGVLPFADSHGHDTPLTRKLYEALKEKNDRMRIFPFSTIEAQQGSWGLSTLTPSNKRILIALEDQLSMNFAVSGTVYDTLGTEFSLQLIRCKDAATIFTQEFRTTGSSTAIDDAVKFLLKGVAPVYTSSRGVEVKFP
jgi:hypothetical protein